MLLYYIYRHECARSWGLALNLLCHHIALLQDTLQWPE